MLVNFKKHVCPLFLSMLMIFMMIPSSAFASEEDVVSKEKLTEIVTEDVSSLDFESLGVDKVINSINDTVKENVTQTVKKVLTPENIKILLKAAIKAEIKGNLDKYNIPEYIDIDKLVDTVVDSKAVDRLLTDELTQKIIDRTIDYAVSDIMDEIKVPTTEEVITASKSELIEKSVEDIYNADNKEALYYSYKLELKGLKLVKTITGWNETSVEAKVKLNAAAVISENCKMPDLDSIDYTEIIKNAAKRAVRDVIKEEIQEADSNIKNTIKDEIDKVINSVKK